MRKYTNKILELMDEGYINRDLLIRNLLNWMSEAEVEEFFKSQIAYDEYFLGEDE